MINDPKIVFLDEGSIQQGDIDLSQLISTGSYTGFQSSKANQVHARIKNADIVITNKVVLDQRNLKNSSVKLICVTATGVNNIDLNYCDKNKITVTNCTNYATESVAERTLLFLLNISHRHQENFLSCTNGTWSKSKTFNLTLFPYKQLKGKVLGLIGYGTIGKEVARLAKAFGMIVQIAKIPGQNYPKSPARKSLDVILKTSDFVSIHCMLSSQSHHLIDAPQLKLMSPHATLINLARGAVVNENAVLSALKNNKIFHYASDVFENEPLPKNHPFLQKKIQNKVTMSPHNSWASLEGRQEILRQITHTIYQFKRNKPIKTLK